MKKRIFNLIVFSFLVGLIGVTPYTNAVHAEKISTYKNVDPGGTPG